MKLGAFATLVLLLAVVGCGGGGTSAEEAWAEDVCTSIAAWKTEVESIAANAADAITEPGATVADVEAAVEDGLAATRTLVAELRAADPPETPGRAEARAAVDDFLAGVQASDDKVRTALAGIPEGADLSDVVAGLSGLAADLQQTVESGRTLVTDIQQLGGELKDGFENADACQELREST